MRSVVTITAPLNCSQKALTQHAPSCQFHASHMKLLRAENVHIVTKTIISAFDLAFIVARAIVDCLEKAFTIQVHSVHIYLREQQNHSAAPTTKLQ